MINHQIIINKKKDGKIRFTADPTVIDERLIREAMKKHFEENKVPNMDGLPFSELRVLSLSFQNIHKIQNLDGLVNLEKLQLDNNIIEEIEGISHLVKLKWLDLSFNCIKKIKNLDTLTELQDLSLYNNEIVTVEGLDKCTKLNVLSLGNNKIDNLDAMYTYLKQFKKLEVLNVAGNPFIKKEADYKLYIMLHLTSLKYLDYSFIDEAMRNLIKEDEKLRGELAQQELQMRQQEEIEREENEKKARLAKLKEAKIAILETLTDEMFSKEDLDYERIRKIKGIEEEIQKFIDRIKEATLELQKRIIPKNEIMIAKVQKFVQELNEKIRETENETKAIIQVFEREKKHIFRRIDAAGKDYKDELTPLRDKLEKLDKDLMNIELEFVEIESSAIEGFEYTLRTATDEMTTMVSETFQIYKQESTELNNTFTKIANEEMDRFAKSTDESEWDEEQAAFLENRDTVTMAISQFFENLQTKLIKKEADIASAIKEEARQFIAKKKEEQYERNRKNISNIANLISMLRREIDERRHADDESESNA